MSSRFVSGGTNEQPIERDEEWLKAQQAIDAARREKQDRGKQVERKSLYETLQQNKAAKQEAFEESIKLKNQFKALDEDEIDYLDSVRESERAKEEAIRQETREQLERFRQHQEAVNKANRAEAQEGGASPTGNQASPPLDRQWTVSGKKRRRGSEKEFLKGVKVRKSSTSETDARSPLGDAKADEKKPKSPPETNKVEATADVTGASAPNDTIGQGLGAAQSSATKANPANPANLGLAAYASDSD